MHMVSDKVLWKLLLNLLEDEGGSLQFGLLGEDRQDKFKRFRRCKLFLPRVKDSLLEKLEVEHVRYEAEEQVYLRNDEEDLLSHSLNDYFRQQTL